MKEWFRYEFGYVNIDDENLYLTNTGNWQETLRLDQKTVHSGRRNKYRRTRIMIFFIISSLLLALLSFRVIINSRNIILPLFGVPLLGVVLYLYRFFKPDMGVAYKIPIKEIREVLIEENDVLIRFINGNGKADMEKLMNVEKKGINLLSTIKSEHSGQPDASLQL